MNSKAQVQENSRGFVGNLPRNSDRWAYVHQANHLTTELSQLHREFDRNVRFYDALLSRYLPADPEGLILDLPCGEGQMLHALKSLGYHQVKGYDLDAARVQVACRLGLPAYQGDVFEVLAEQPDDSLAACISMDFLEHLEKEQVLAFLPLARRKLKAGASFIIRTPCADSPFGLRHIYNDFTHCWAATSGVLAGLLAGAGFKNVRIFGEEPKRAMAGGWVRVPLYHFSVGLANLATRFMNVGPVKIWTSSMWGVAAKL